MQENSVEVEIKEEPKEEKKESFIIQYLTKGGVTKTRWKEGVKFQDSRGQTYEVQKNGSWKKIKEIIND